MTVVMKHLAEQKKMKDSKQQNSNHNSIALNNQQSQMGNGGSTSPMTQSNERALNLIKKVFKTSKKQMFLSNSPENKDIVANETVIQIKPTKTEKHSLFTRNYEEKEELEAGYDKDESSYEDEDPSKYDILKANRYLLYFSSTQESLAQEFYDQSCKRTQGHMKIMLWAFAMVYLFQTLIIISVRIFIKHYLTILLIKGGIAIIMIIFIFWIKFFYTSTFMKMLMFLLSFATLVMAVVQGYESDFTELNTVQAIELVIVFAFMSYLPYI